MILEQYCRKVQAYLFAALSGTFLYITLSSLFPVLQDLIEDDDEDDLETLNNQNPFILRRFILANIGFLVAVAIVLPPIYYEHDLQVLVQHWLCDFFADSDH